MPKNSLIVCVLASLLVTACSDALDPGQARQTNAIGNDEPSIIQERSAAYLVEARIAAQGSFRPGQPIQITAHGRGLSGNSIDMELIVLDIESATGIQRLDDARRLPGITRHERRATFQFDSPGYYRILVTVTDRGPLSSDLAGRDVVRSLTETLWILVDEAGGRLTNGFDSQVVKGRNPLFGAYGPFKSRTGNNVGTAQLRANSSSSSGAMYVFGTYKYWDSTTQPVSVGAYVPVKGGWITATCVGRSSDQVIIPDVNYDVTASVASNGTWTVVCPADMVYAWDYAQGNIYPIGSYANVQNHLGSSIASGFNGNPDDNLTIYAASNYQAHVLSTLETHIPIGNSAFGRSRGSRIAVRVHDTSSTFEIGYRRAEDRIDTNYTRIFNTDGVYVTIHEFGHAFHWTALERPDTFECTPPDHTPGEVENISCAFVEGFADFFAAYIGGSYFYAGHHSADYDMEHHNYATSTTNNGWRREGAVAGFLYDLVDNASSPNHWDNTSDGLDDDAASYSASAIGDIIASCSTNGGTRIDGIDQFIYCAEQSLAAQDLTHPAVSDYYFRARRDIVVYTSYSVGSHSLSSSVVRTLWLKNLFGQ